jgi:hypothetical protein
MKNFSLCHCVHYVKVSGKLSREAHTVSLSAMSFDVTNAKLKNTQTEAVYVHTCMYTYISSPAMETV